MNKISKLLSIAFSLSFFIISCTNDSNTTNTNASDSTQINIQKDSIANAQISDQNNDEIGDGFTYLDTTVKVFGDYSISEIKYNDGERDGLTNIVTNTKTGVSYEIGGSIETVQGNYLLIGPDGSETSNENTCSIYHLIDGSELYHFYMAMGDSYKIEKGQIKLFAKINSEEVSDKSKLPNCEKVMNNPDLIYSHVEEKIINTQTGEVKNTGKYKCAYFE